MTSIQKGFSLIELVVAIAILGVLMAAGVPGLSSWMQNSQVRATAESVLAAIQLARGEAVKQNIQTQFQVSNTGGIANWTIIPDSLTAPNTFPSANKVQTSSTNETGKKAAITVSTSQSYGDNCKNTIATDAMASSPGIVFNAFGRIADGGTPITRIDVTSAAAPANRMVILVSSAGRATLCKPNVEATSTLACPTTCPQ